MNAIFVIQFTVLVFVAIAGTAVVLTRDPRSQVVGLSFYGLVLTVAFFVFQAPDVALSQLVIGAVALPMMFMLGLTRIQRDRERREWDEKHASKQAKRKLDKPEAA
jgi:energy-converting hydrogenase B subunit D